MASRKEREEWTDYFDTDMEGAIRRGCFDDILDKVKESIADREAFIAQTVPVGEVLTKMVNGVQKSAPSYGEFSPNPNVWPCRWYPASDIVGKTVALNSHIRPAYLRGVKVKVVKFGVKHFTVEVVPSEVIRLRGRRFDKSFRCPASLFAIDWS